MHGCVNACSCVMDEGCDAATCKELLMDNLEFNLYHESAGNEGPPWRDQVERHPTSSLAGDLVLQVDQKDSNNMMHAPASTDENEPRTLADVHLVDARRDELFIAFEALKANGFLSVSTVGCTDAHEVAPGHSCELIEEGEKATSNIVVKESQTPSRENEALQCIEDPEVRRTAKRLARNRLSAKRARERAKLRLHQLECENRKLSEEKRQLKQIVYFLFAKMRQRHE